MFTYRVRQSFGARLDDRIKLDSTTDDGSCGLRSNKGRKVALGIDRQRRGWSSNLCSYMEPKALRAVAGERGGRGSGSRAACFETFTDP